MAPEFIKFGSLYFDGRPQRVGAAYYWESLSLGSTVPGLELQWVRLQNGILIADRCVCSNISWEQLNQSGFIYGTPIQIDGHAYLCRSLCVGSKKGDPNEWDTALDEVGSKNDIWHWKDMFFWGQEQAEKYPADYSRRGFDSAGYWSHAFVSHKSAYSGFRPVLEPLTQVVSNCTSITGERISLWGPQGENINGILISVDDYDLTLDQTSFVPENHSWAIKTGNRLILKRDKIWAKSSCRLT